MAGPATGRGIRENGIPESVQYFLYAVPGAPTTQRLDAPKASRQEEVRLWQSNVDFHSAVDSRLLPLGSSYVNVKGLGTCFDLGTLRTAARTVLHLTKSNEPGQYR